MAEMGVATNPKLERHESSPEEIAKAQIEELEQDRKEREENHQHTSEFADKERERRRKQEEETIEFHAKQQAHAAERARDMDEARGVRDSERSYTYTGPVVGVAPKK